MRMAGLFAERGTCPRAQVGCVIVDRGHVIAHGYNGAPHGLPHCDTVAGCVDDRVGQGCANAVHAEENSIAYAARVGVSCHGASLFCTHEPCLRCARLIVQSGIQAVYYATPYREHGGLHLLYRAGLEVTHYA